MSRGVGGHLATYRPCSTSCRHLSPLHQHESLEHNGYPQVTNQNYSALTCLSFKDSHIFRETKPDENVEICICLYLNPDKFMSNPIYIYTYVYSYIYIYILKKRQARTDRDTGVDDYIIGHMKIRDAFAGVHHRQPYKKRII